MTTGLQKVHLYIRHVSIIIEKVDAHFVRRKNLEDERCRGMILL